MGACEQEGWEYNMCFLSCETFEDLSGQRGVGNAESAVRIAGSAPCPGWDRFSAGAVGDNSSVRLYKGQLLRK